MHESGDVFAKLEDHLPRMASSRGRATRTRTGDHDLELTAHYLAPSYTRRLHQQLGPLNLPQEARRTIFEHQPAQFRPTRPDGHQGPQRIGDKAELTSELQGQEEQSFEYLKLCPEHTGKRHWKVAPVKPILKISSQCDGMKRVVIDKVPTLDLPRGPIIHWRQCNSQWSIYDGNQ